MNGINKYINRLIGVARNIKLHIGYTVFALALLAAITGTAASVLPTSIANIHSLSLVSTISGAASTLISAHHEIASNRKS